MPVPKGDEEDLMAAIDRIISSLTAAQREVFDMIVADDEGYDDALVADYLSLDSVSGERVTARQVANFRDRDDA